MRIHLKTTPNTEKVPFEYVPKLVGTLHKWIGKNELHDGFLSLYSFSMLKNGKKKYNHLHFEYGAEWFISTHDEAIAKQILKGILQNPEICFGLNVASVTLEDTPDFDGKRRFQLASPVLLKEKQENGTTKHHLYSSPQSGVIMTNILKNKLSKAGMSSDNLSVYFDLDYAKPHTKLIDYKGIKNKANICPVIIEGTPEQIAFAWNVGIGNSTGIGFGSII